MSSQDQLLVSLLSQLVLSFDGAVLGLSAAYVAVRSIRKFTVTSAALRKITHAPSVPVSDLRSLLENVSEDNRKNSGDGKIVIVRGTVDAKSAVDGSWKALWPGVLVSRESGDKGVVLQRTQRVTNCLFCVFQLQFHAILLWNYKTNFRFDCHEVYIQRMERLIWMDFGSSSRICEISETT